MLGTKGWRPSLPGRPVGVASVAVSLVVGTVLTLANHGDALFAGRPTVSLAWVIPLTYGLSLVLVLASETLMGPGADMVQRPDDPGAKESDRAPSGSAGHRR